MDNLLVVIKNEEEFKEYLEGKLKEFNGYHEDKIEAQLYNDWDPEQDSITVELSSAWTISGNTELLTLWIEKTIDGPDTKYVNIEF